MQEPSRFQQTTASSVNIISQDPTLIEAIAEDLLAIFRAAPLLNAYDAYQHLMDYWAATMQDDCYLIAEDGWVAKTYRVKKAVDNGKNKGEMKDKGWACDLIPKPYIVARYFAKEQTELDTLQTELDAVSASLAELAEEYGGDEGVLKDVSTKGDALEAYTQALVAVWSEEDKAASRAYGTFMNQVGEHAAKIRTLSDHYFISGLKSGNKGNLPLKVIKDRLIATSDPNERETLARYLDEDKKKKAARGAFQFYKGH